MWTENFYIGCAQVTFNSFNLSFIFFLKNNLEFYIFIYLIYYIPIYLCYYIRIPVYRFPFSLTVINNLFMGRIFKI